MQINWKRGFLRAWIVFACAWIGLTGWYEYAPDAWHVGGNLIRTKGECWEQIAKWPDGQPFTEWDAMADEVDTLQNIDANKERHAWAADSIAVRNQWVHGVRQKLADCESSRSTLHLLSLRIHDIWFTLMHSLHIIILPPIVVLIAGFLFGWVARGFRVKSTSSAQS
jgi:hypothetical protein